MDKTRTVADRAREDAINLLSGTLTAESEGQIEQRCREVPGYQEEFLETTRLMASLESLAEDSDVEQVLGHYQSTHSQKRSPAASKWRWSVAGMAAGLLLAVTVFLTFETTEQKPLVKIDRYITQIGEQKDVTLDDGSVLSMNTGTLMLVEMTGTSRRVILERGEVYFDVAKDPERPFTVAMGERSVSVLGTEFNIHKSPDQFTLAVVEGTVSIHKPEAVVDSSAPLLAPPQGESLTLTSSVPRKVNAQTVVEYQNDGDRMTASVDHNVSRYQQWRTGILSFRNEPLGKVVQQLNRYTAKKILVESVDLLDTRIYATIRTDQISMALEGLEKSLPIKVVVHFDRIVVSEKP
ncbi:FecR domain-containing protein [Porticoccus sp. W117]|uniref:FecR family protein n=1 Tax=Porticoccus sp. W117 TaxID=3054777 RepID=UPI002595A6C4|nr:FecR domain-containing protein [Porticoccus sp. W117]MDM3871434.1 FecR domain-containing protein [Porticoccus sp. W117]